MSVRERGAVLIWTEFSTLPLVLRGFRKRSTFVLSDSSARGYIPSSVVGQGCRKVGREKRMREREG